MLGHGGLLDGTVKQARDDGAPQQEGESEGAQHSTDTNEDGAVGQR
jgi:hypothetical protein